MSEAQAFALFMEEVDRRLDAAPHKSQEWASITREYNSKALVPSLYKKKGHRSERSLRLWHQKWTSSHRDMFALVHKNTSSQRGRKVTEFESNFLLSHCLSDSKLPILSVIKALKADAQLGLCESPSSLATLKRWIQDWQRSNPDQWAQARKGSKYVKDTIVKSIMRDTSMIKCGDVLVIDGHTLAFDVVSPLTGKPARLTLILLFDWASRYPVGASLAMTESSEHVLTAVRNAILHVGMLPKFIYFDNGKAFRSKLFHAKWEDHDLSLEFAGIFPRLGIEAEFAEAYNARSKVIERFFRTMQEQFERFQTTFRGRNIDDKPANLSRNEKWAQKLFRGTALQYDEALDLTYYYFRHIYGMTPHSALGSRKPYEVFSAREIDPARVIPAERLNFLMLKAERKHLRSEGIWLNKCRYYHDSFVKHIGQSVIIRYDYSDLRWILVYDNTGRFIAQAPIREQQHGFIYLEKDNPLAHQALVAEIRANKRMLRAIESATTHTIKNATAKVEAELAKHRHIKDALLEDISQSNPTFRQDPMIQAPIEPESVQDAVAHLAAQARAQELENKANDHIIDAPTPGNASNQPEGLSPAEGSNQAQPLTMTNILKRRGIL